MKVFHIDNGRKYFSPVQLKNIIDVMGKNDYDMLELSIGNGGMRFLLDDMTITTEYGVYQSEEVKTAINAGNKKFCNNGTNELTEAEMEDLISLAKERNILIMPLLNTPGHMDAIVSAMEVLGIGDARFKGSASTIDLDNKAAVAFTKAYVKKYAEWFSTRGSKCFNMGCDEYANDVLSSGFEVLCNPKDFKYDRFISYVNELADMIVGLGMIPVMFNDGAYYNCNTLGGDLSNDILVSYWSTGWPGYTPAPATFVQSKGHKILNTSANWYYVLGRRPSSQKKLQFTDMDAIKGIHTTAKEDIMGSATEPPIGSMLCLWCDEPYVEYSLEEENIVSNLIDSF